MNAPQKGIEVDLKEIGCPYPAEDSRTSIWIEAYFRGKRDGLDDGARVASDAYDKALGVAK